MTEENIQESAAAGSFEGTTPSPANAGEQGGETTPQFTEEMYKELETKLGEQGSELGEYRTFFKNVSPLLEKLDDQPELVQAIIEGKVTADLAKAVSEGKVSLEDAAEVTEAQKEVKKQVGDKELSKLSPETIEELITKQVDKAKVDLNKTLSDSEDMREFQDYTNDFIKSTSDFAEHADAISEWFDKNPKQDDIKIAYYAVKGAKAEAGTADDAKKGTAEAAKELAANAAGGGSQGGKLPDGTDVIDTLIAGKANPNVF